MAKPQTVIVADDEPEILELVEAILAGEGFHVLTCADGRTAFELFLRQPLEVALIICDLRLPKMGPMRLYEAIAETDFPVPSMLVFSGLIEPRNLVDLFGGGLTHFLAKPFSVPALVREVRSLVAARESSATSLAEHSPPCTRSNAAITSSPREAAALKSRSRKSRASNGISSAMSPSTWRAAAAATGAEVA